MLWSAFILGLLGSFHCVGMCGPIAFMLPVDRSNSLKKISLNFPKMILYKPSSLVNLLKKYISNLHFHHHTNHVHMYMKDDCFIYALHYTLYNY